jgi:hypothetical protein
MRSGRRGSRVIVMQSGRARIPTSRYFTATRSLSDSTLRRLHRNSTSTAYADYAVNRLSAITGVDCTFSLPTFFLGTSTRRGDPRLALHSSPFTFHSSFVSSDNFVDRALSLPSIMLGARARRRDAFLLFTFHPSLFTPALCHNAALAITNPSGT